MLLFEIKVSLVIVFVRKYETEVRLFSVHYPAINTTTYMIIISRYDTGSINGKHP